MDKFLTLTVDERIEAFKEAANRRGIQPIIIEKDFWVCWTLAHLFSITELAPHITFKGGTSLSKAYGLIERFSEDIDLTISKDFLGITATAEESGISGKEKKRRIDALKQAAQQCVEQTILPILQSNIVLKLGEDFQISLDPEDKDSQTILFFYPCVYAWGRVPWQQIGHSIEVLNQGNYIKPVIRLEFGARGDTTPAEEKVILPYIAQEFPSLFIHPSTVVPTLAAERTFWEKVTALHAFYHGAKPPERWSRHYYDIYMMIEAGIAEQALGNMALLEDVVRNKSIYFKDAKASYETAVPGRLKLIPSPEAIADLKQDYTAMSIMFMGDHPSFEKLLDSLSALEMKINNVG